MHWLMVQQLRVLSPREEPVIVPKGTRIATLEALEREPPDDVIQVHAVSATGNKSLSSSEEGVLWEMVSKSLVVPYHSSTEEGWVNKILYRKVNAVTRKDAYPMPRVDDTLGGSKFFSTLDLANGYWQVEVEEKDTQKTALNTPEGLYEFRVMPFGLCNAPATFQRLMERVLGDMKWTDCLVYVDDIIVVGKTFPDHLHHLGNVLSRLRQAGLKLQPAKCKFFQQQVCFLGHVLLPGGVSPDPSKTDVVAEWPIPTNKKEVQQFLGLANYYRRFIKNFASIAKPLQRLTEKNLNFFEWTDTCQDAFNHLRKCLVTAPILAFPDFSKKFILDTDASDCGIGAVLAQVQDDGSEIPCSQCGRKSHSTDEFPLEEDQAVCQVSELPFQSYTLEQIRQLQLSDPSLGPVLRAVEINNKPHQDQLKSWSQESRRLMQFWETLLVKDGTLWRLPTTDGQQFQLVVPFILRDDILDDLHAGMVGGHMGEEKLVHRLLERFYWTGCAERAKEWCRTCPKCVTRKTGGPKRIAELKTIHTGYPMQVVAVDIMGPLPTTSDGNRYVLVAGDYFTKWVEAYAIPNQEAGTVAKKLVDYLFCQFSPPEQLHSDQGRQFVSQLLQEICALLKIKKSRTSPYHPQGNGMVERFNRTLLDMLATTVSDNQANWEQCIRKVCFAYNSSVHSSTRFTPFFLMFGRQAKLPVDLMYGSSPQEVMLPVGEYVQNLRNTLQNAYALVRERLQVEHQRQKEFYD
eukprot:Em0009g699a